MPLRDGEIVVSRCAAGRYGPFVLSRVPQRIDVDADFVGDAGDVGGCTARGVVVDTNAELVATPRPSASCQLSSVAPRRAHAARTRSCAEDVPVSCPASAASTSLVVLPS